MRCLIVLSGTVTDSSQVRTWLKQAERIYCVDGGARHLRRLDYLPDVLIGDLDSIEQDDLDWLEKKDVPLRRYPAEKDATDSELALDLLFSDLPPPADQHQIVVLGALGSRPDHVLANQLLAARLAEQGWRLLLSDGVSEIHTLIGGQRLDLDLPPFSEQQLAVSIVPVSSEISGLCYSGLKYPLDQARLSLGSTRGISNQVADRSAERTEGGQPSVQIKLSSGVMLVVVTPAV